ncbi:predicted protein [Pyrenophora tritici-repentis Pt-1C-BFP]|uniref:Uncharacterized protein n=1 Tax=Pyrenophora tritici-repentis (strain Pt-1C-BFP) TaxID=426418 RepID=B2W600_PYRTR|nr:uncharacterized protein PTRG_06158 [Pyrenophora tritici-repentis Pt-1C-BFP]EDU49078.1 predicted protein [Pyrenophora tritici-repentis Pt-1C-BFP]
MLGYRMLDKHSTQIDDSWRFLTLNCDINQPPYSQMARLGQLMPPPLGPLGVAMGRRCSVERQGPKGYRQVRLLSHIRERCRGLCRAKAKSTQSRLDWGGGRRQRPGLAAWGDAIPALVLMRQLNDRLLVRLQAAAGMDWVTRARGSGHSTDACRD